MQIYFSLVLIDPKKIRVMELRFASLFYFAIGIVILATPRSTKANPLMSETLLQSGSASSVDSGLQSGRYESTSKTAFKYLPVKAKPKGLVIPSRKRRDPAQVAEGAMAEASTEDTIASTKSNDKGSKESAPESSVNKAATSSKESAPETTAAQEKESAKNSTENVSGHIYKVFSGHGAEAYAEYAQDIDGNDRRLNRLELETVAGFMSNGSRSNYAYRNYDSFSHVLGVNGNIWLTPLVGITGGYETTLNADVAGYNGARVSAKQDWTNIGILGRHYFGLKKTSPFIQGGLLYSENRMTLPTDEKLRVNLKSSGIGVGIKWTVPTSPTFAWNFGFEIFPRLSHSEASTGINLQSGNGADSSRLGLSWGSEWISSRQSQIFWNIQMSSEKNVFTGSANLTDPESGRTPTGVSVANTWTFFHIGYRWGQ